MTDTYNDIPAIFWYTTKDNRRYIPCYREDWYLGQRYVGFLDQPSPYITEYYALTFDSYTQTLKRKVRHT